MKMRSRKHLALLVLGLLFILITINLVNNRYTTLSSHDAQLTLNDSSAVCHILIRRANDSLFLSRRDNETWILPDQRIVNPAYLKFVFRIFSQLKIASVVPKNQWGAIRDSILRNGIEIAFYNQQQSILHNIYLFPDRQNQKTFALKKSAQEPFMVELPGYEGNFSGLFYLPVTQWYQPVIIHYNPQQIREIYVDHVESPDKSFTLRILPGQQPILLDIENDPHPYSEEALKAYLTFLRNISVEKYIDKQALYDSLAQTNPIYRVRIVDQADSVNQLTFYPIRIKGKIDKNFCYVLTPKGLVGIISYYRIDPVARPIEFFTSFGQ